MTKAGNRDTLIRIFVWLFRILVGATFIFSGFAKAVDPWGFMYKMEDYLVVWGIDWMPSAALFCSASVIALVEFTAGVLLALGCMRKAVVWLLLAMMSLLLPLTVYIFFANPVDDCGCFGDALVISNGMTLLKNIVITILLLFLFCYNTATKGIIPILMQWIAMVACIIYCVILSLIGYIVQPIVDFRPYSIGEKIINGSDDFSDIKFIYEKDGVTEEFSADALPDSTWTFVDRTISESGIRGGDIAIYDGDEDVTCDVISEEGPFVILSVPNPEYHNRSRASMANRIFEYMQAKGGSMIGLVPLSGEKLEDWKKLSNPMYDVYTAEDTSLKELARGDASIIYLYDGVIKWKRNIYSLPGDFPDLEKDTQFDDVKVVDSGTYIFNITLALIIVLVVLSLMGSSHNIWIYARRKSSNHQKDKKPQVKD